MYGPTETAVYVTAAELAAGACHRGTPLDNCRIYVLDQELRPVLPTVRGNSMWQAAVSPTGMLLVPT